MRIKSAAAVITLLVSTLGLTFAFAENAGEAHLPQFISSGPVIVNLPLEASPFTAEAYTSVPIETLPAASDIQKKINLEIGNRGQRLFSCCSLTI